VTGRQASTSRPDIRGRLLGLVLVTHPIPSSLYVVAVGLFSWLAAAASHRGLDPGRLAQVLAGVACAQIAVGATNDYRDRELDALSRPRKPIVRGLIVPGQARALAYFASAGVLLLMTPLGFFALVLGLLIEGLGLAYDFGLKGTPFSTLLFAVYFPLIPLLAWVVFGHRQGFLPWLVPLGALLGVAMDIANSLPDLEDDMMQGAHGLPHLLGLRWGLAAAWGLPLVALALIWTLDLSGAVPAHLPGLLVASACVLLSTGAAAALFARRASSSTLRLTFIIQAMGVVGTATGWLAAVAF
jgi:4-hydroxybenzoate polyprenyltransferase